MPDADDPAFSPPPATRELSPERREALAALLQRLSLQPLDSAFAWLETALTHRSFGQEQGVADNERLEFLGDAIISHATTEFLFETRPTASEGDLSKIRAAAVSRKILGEVAAGLEIGSLLRLGTGEERSGGRRRSSTLGSGLEAIVGACSLVYRWEDLRPGLRTAVVKPALELVKNRVLYNYKSQLQEWTQANGLGVPEYRLSAARGPDHARDYVMEAWLGGKAIAQGHGRRKQWAENDAARAAMQVLQQSEGNSTAGE